VRDWEMPLPQLPAPHDDSLYVREWFLVINVRARLTEERLVVTLELQDQLWGRDYEFRPFPENYWRGLPVHGSEYTEIQRRILGGAGPDALPADESWLRRAMALVVGRDGVRGLEGLAEERWIWVHEG
jgi:hypothetical protein